MKFIGKRIFSAMLILAIFLTQMNGIVTAFAQKNTEENLLEYAKKAVEWQRENSVNGFEQAGTSALDWLIIAQSRLGFNADYEEYLSRLEENKMKEYESENNAKLTECCRTILTVLACGGDPTDFCGENLLESGIFQRAEENSFDIQGLNGWIWCLIALDSLQWKITENAELSRECIIDKILGKQLSDGSCAISGKTGDADVTAMAVQALAPYYRQTKDKKIKSFVQKAMNYLATKQKETGIYETCETTSQVLNAVCSIGEKRADFNSTLSVEMLCKGLLQFRNDDGGFSHIIGEKSQSMSTNQAILSLGAAARFSENLNTLFDFSMEFADEKSFDTVEKYCMSMQINETGKGYIYDIENKMPYEESQDRQNEKNAEIERFNGIIMNDLYPFENLSEKQLDELREIYEGVQKLDTADRNKIVGYTEMSKALEKDTTNYWTVILTIVGIFGIAFVFVKVMLKKGKA